MREPHNAPIVLIVVGLLLLVAAAVWPHVSDPQHYWTEADADARAEIGDQYHAILHKAEHSGPRANSRLIEAELHETQKRFEESTAALQEARNRYERPSRWMRIAGAACLILGLIGYYRSRAAGA